MDNSGSPTLVACVGTISQLTSSIFLPRPAISYIRVTMILKSSLILLAFMCLPLDAADNGLAITPPMGWMSWERFRCNTNCTLDPDHCISEKLIMEMADLMVMGGYRDAGYEYVAIDDCWMTHERDKYGRLQADPIRFPSGMKNLSDYIHSRGLKFGIYEDMGLMTCKGYPGSKFYLQMDADTFASWGVDMLKLDCCWAGNDMETGYEVMGFFLNRTGRPIMYSCSFPACQGKKNYILAETLCNTWRNYGDMNDDWDSIGKIIDYYGNDTEHFSKAAGPGHWNDPDELIIGDYGLSAAQEKTQFGMWAMMASPLFMSVDLRVIPKTSAKLLLNKRVIAINQDALGIQGTRIFKVGDLAGWTKPILPKGSYAIAVVNMGHYGEPLYFRRPLKDFGLSNPTGYNLTETFDGGQMGYFNISDQLTLNLEPTGIFLVTAIPY
ncbi:hypothetical protein ScPMuIL_010472 [Solemya velum]